METTHLGHRFTHILGRIFQHPASHNLEWRDVIALIEHLGTVEEEENGHLIFTIQGVSQSFHRTHQKDVSEVQQVLDLRHFLESVGVDKDGVIAPERGNTAPKLRLLVVINQKETLVFRSEDKDSVPERLHPYDPHGVLHHLNHMEGRDIGAREPENITYYQAIAKTLAGAEEVLLMGNGTGASSAMTHLQDYLVAHDAEIAQRIVGTLTLDLEALTEGQLLQEAREPGSRRSYSCWKFIRLLEHICIGLQTCSTVHCEIFPMELMTGQPRPFSMINPDSLSKPPLQEAKRHALITQLQCKARKLKREVRLYV
jgi:hypothetical protein